MPFFGGGGDYKIVGTNVVGGIDALPANVGDDNIALGNNALQNVVDGSSNVAVGKNALKNCEGDENIVIGANAVADASGYAWSNVFIGTSIFQNAGLYGEIDGANIALGTQLGLGSYTTGGFIRNTVLIGDSACTYSSDFGESTIIGSKACRDAQFVGSSVVIGYETLSTAYSFDPVTTTKLPIIVDNNVIIGNETFKELYRYDDTNANRVLHDSVIIGNRSLQFAQTYVQVPHTDLIVIGNNCYFNDKENTPYNNVVAIGESLAITASNSIQIGDASHTSIKIGGKDFSGGPGTPAGANTQLQYNNGGAFGANANLTFDQATNTLQCKGTVIAGDPGTEDGGINVNGVTFNSSLKVSDIDGTNFAQTILHRHSTTLEPLIIGARSNSNTTAHADVTNGQNVFTIYGSGWAGADYKLFGDISISADDTGTISNTSSPGKLVFRVTPNGSTTPQEVARISSDKTAKFQGNIQAKNGYNVPYILAQWAVSSGIAPSGTVGNNGALTLGTALSMTYSGGLYLYFPANAIFAGSAAGFYWCIMSSTTAGKIYNNTYDGNNSRPTYVAAPTAFVTVGPGAYVGVTTSVIFATVNLPGGSLGPNGQFTTRIKEEHRDSANTKFVTAKFGTQNICTIGLTTPSTGYQILNTLSNAGVENKQIGVLNGQDAGGGAVSSFVVYSVNTAADVSIQVLGQLTGAADYMIYHSVNFLVQPGA